MRTFLFPALALVLAFAVSVPAASAIEVSTKNNIGGHFEYAGFTIVPVGDVVPAMEGDLSAPRAFEIFRPGQQAFSVGRLFTSCTCFQVAIDKKDFMTGERAVITLRNVQLTKGQNYPFYVQLNSPLRVVLRHDAFIISDQFSGAAVVQEVVTETAAPEAAVAAVVEAAPAEAAPTAVVPVAIEPVEPAAAPAVVMDTLSEGQEEYLSDKDLLVN